MTVATRPASDVTVAIWVDPPFNRLTADTASLSFTQNDWNVGQDVVLTAADDSSASKFWGVVTHTATGGGYDGEAISLRVTVQDDD